MIDKQQLTEIELDRIIEMAWEDRTPFEAILYQFGLTEKEVIKSIEKEIKLFEKKIKLHCYFC